ncbi:MAG: dockerin type I repeat-containing protein, partial [Saprospiraceae bacterium]
MKKFQRFMLLATFMAFVSFSSFGQFSCNNQVYASLASSTSGGDASVIIYPEIVTNGNSSTSDIQLSLNNTDFYDSLTFYCDDIGDHLIYVKQTIDGVVEECTSTVTVEDKLSPIPYVLSTVTISMDNSGSATLLPSDVNIGSYDNCEIASMTVSQSVFTVAGTYTVEFTVTDPSGNSDSALFSVIVIGSGESSVNCVSVSSGVLDIFSSELTVYAVDFVLNMDDFEEVLMSLEQEGPYTSSLSIACGDLDNSITTIYVQGTDSEGNVSQCESTFTLFDVNPPIALTSLNNCLTLVDGAAVLTTADVDNGSYDLCSDVTLSLSQTDFTTEDIGINTVILTIEDGSGNINQAVIMVVVNNENVLDPIIVCPSDITISCVEDYQNTGTTGVATAINGCAEVDVSYEDILVSLNDDNEGFVNRKWSVVDDADVYCTQVITLSCDISACELEDVDFPLANLFITEPNINSSADVSPDYIVENTGYTYAEVWPVFPGECNNLALSYSDQVITTGTNNVFKILRTWTIIDWIATTTSTYTQIIKVNFINDVIVCNNNVQISVSESQPVTLSPLMVIEFYPGPTSNLVVTVNDENNNVIPNNILTVDYLGQELTAVVTDITTEISCWSIITLTEVPNGCVLDFENDVSLPIDIVVQDENAQLENLSPENLVSVYGYAESDVNVIIDNDCALAGFDYSDVVYNNDDGTFKIVRTFTIIDWISYDSNTNEGIWTHIQTIIVGEGPNSIICDILPRSADVGDCDSGHTLDDNIEWPNDIQVSDPRLSPEDLISFSFVNPLDAQPELISDADDFSLSYVDLFNGFPTTTTVKIGRLWTVTHNEYAYQWFYTQEILVSFSDFDNLVTVNTAGSRAMANVDINGEFTDVLGIAHTEESNINIQYEDDYLNGLNILDLALMRAHILGHIQLTDDQINAADLNNNNIVTTLDIVLLKRTIEGVTVETKSGWTFEEIATNTVFEDNSRSFKGIKEGDIDDSAVLQSAPPINPEVVFNYEDQLLNAGETYYVPIRFSQEQVVKGIEMRFNINTEDINITNILSTKFDNDEISFHVTEDGELTILSLTTSDILFASNDLLIQLEIEALNNSLLSLAINDSNRPSYIVDADYNLKVIGGDVKNIIGVSTNSPELEGLIAFPNPVSGILNF